LRVPSFLRRRPSAALIVSCVALFISLGGASYAAVTIPNNSVGAAQLKKNAVTNAKLDDNAVSYKKIQAGAVGNVRANLSQLQSRVSKTCVAGTAIGAIAKTGGAVTCNTTLPAGLQTTSNTAAISATATSPTTITSLVLPAGPAYLALANPTVSVTSTATPQRVQASCTLTVGSNTQTRAVTLVTSGTATNVTTGSIPLQLTGASGTATVTCSATVATGTLPDTSATAALDALQIAPAAS
jgi:hypothetical protein